MEQTDAALFEKWLHKRDAEAFKTLASRYAAMVFTTCRRVLGNPTEAEDVAQECFVILATTRKGVGGYLAPWLHRVAYNRSLARLRSERRRREREVRFAAEQEAADGVPWGKLEEFVDEAIGGLPEKLRIPLVAYYLDGMTQETIAQTLGIPRSTVTGRVEQGVERLRKKLKSKGVAIAAAALTALFESAQAETAPAAVSANLGKLALSGASRIALTSSMGAAPAAGFWTLKAVLSTSAGALLALLAGWGIIAASHGSAQTAKANPQLASAATAVSAAVQAPQPGEPKESNAGTQQQSASAAPVETAPVAPKEMPTVLDRGLSIVSDVGDTISNTWDGLRDTLSGERGRRMECQNNLKQFGLLFKIFAHESENQFFPMLSSKPGHLMFANENPGMAPIYPDFFNKATMRITDVGAEKGFRLREGTDRMLVCPSDTQTDQRVQNSGESLVEGGGSYYYLGYAVMRIGDLQAFAEAYKERIAQGLPFDTDLDVPGGKVFRLREGVEANFITDPNNPAAGAKAQSEIPVLIESPHHNPKGGNVLFMDGHVEYRRFTSSGNYPMDQETMDILVTMSGMK